MRSAFLSLLLCLAPATGEATDAFRDWYVWTPDETRLYVAQLGTAHATTPPVLVLHGGFGAEHSYLLPALSPLAPAHRFTLFDQRGSLRSPVARDRIAFDRMVDDVDVLRRELGAEQVTLVAHSMGAVLAYAYLRDHPDRVARLVLVAPVFPFHSGVSPDAPLFEALGLPASDPDYMADVVAAYRDFGASADARADALIEDLGLDVATPSGVARTDAWRIRFASTNLHHLDRWRDVRGGQAFFDAGVYPTLVENAGGHDAWRDEWNGLFDALSAFEGPLTLIVGRQDFIDPAFRFWPRIASRLPRARLVALDAAGHLPWIDQPARFLDAMDRALTADVMESTARTGEVELRQSR